MRNYGHRFDEVREHVEACNFCCKRFDTMAAVQGAGIPIVGEGKAHMKLSKYVLDGWNVVTF